MSSNYTETRISRPFLAGAPGNISLPTIGGTTTATAPSMSPASQFASPTFSSARKRILSENDMHTFKESAAYADLINFICDLSISTLGQDCLPTEPFTMIVPGEVKKENNTTDGAEQSSEASSSSMTASPALGAAAAAPTTEASPAFSAKGTVATSAAVHVQLAKNVVPELKPGDTIIVPRVKLAEEHMVCAVTPVFVALFDLLHRWITDIPLEKMHKSRFGNVSFRTWQLSLRSEAKEWAKKLVDAGVAARAACGNPLPADSTMAADVTDELVPYLFDAFGNATRIDFGTGHELHFVLVVYVLYKNGLLATSPASSSAGAAAAAAAGSSSGDDTHLVSLILREMALVVFDDYLRLMTRIQQHYRLEPAGSHGVWGLDDYHHLPFILGAAQLSPAKSWDKSCLSRPASQSSSATLPNAPLPADITAPRSCEQAAPKNFLFRAVLGIHKVKSGPFGEHSRVLHGVSVLQSWPRVLTGMIKMYSGEVLDKFLIVQHLLFGKTFPWPM